MSGDNENPQHRGECPYCGSDAGHEAGCATRHLRLVDIDWPENPYDQAAEWSRNPLHAARWPYGPPAFHTDACLLHERPGYCDCEASDAEDQLWGWGA